MKKHYLTKVLLTVAFVVAACVAARAQGGSVTGRITDAAGAPVVGVLVAVDGTNRVTVTGANGDYSLVSEPNATLTISFPGYLTQQVAVNNRSVVNVTLGVDVESIDEVVVVGFGTQRKVNLTGSVGMVDSEAFETRPVSNVV